MDVKPRHPMVPAISSVPAGRRIICLAIYDHAVGDRLILGRFGLLKYGYTGLSDTLHRMSGELCCFQPVAQGGQNLGVEIPEMSAGQVTGMFHGAGKDRDLLALLVMGAAILWFVRDFVDPRYPGIPLGIDIGDDLSYLGLLRSELLDFGRLLTWWNVAHHGIPLIGHPNTQFFYIPLTLPSLVLGTAGGVRAAYVFSFLAAGGGMYSLARLPGSRPVVAGWIGLMFAMSGGLTARIHAGHLQKVLAILLIPIVLVCVLQAGPARMPKTVAAWAFTAGLVHGMAFLAGDTYIPLFLIFAVPFMFAVINSSQGNTRARFRLPLALSAWAAGIVAATAGKLLAAIPVLTETVRDVDPYYASQHSYWTIVHFVLPSYSTVPGLSNFHYGAQRITWSWWEFTQYLGATVMVLAVIGAVAVVFRPKFPERLLDGLHRRREVLALVGLFVIGTLWLANAERYSPVHWLFWAVPYLENFRIPSRFLMVSAAAVLSLGAVGLELGLRSSTTRARAVFPAVALLSLGTAWWVNADWFQPAVWICGVPEASHIWPLSACGLLVPIAVVIALIGVAFLIRLVRPPIGIIFTLFIGLVAVVALFDVYHATRFQTRVGEAPMTAELRGAIKELRSRDQGPFLVGSGNFGYHQNTSLRLVFAEQGVPVNWDVSPLRPEHQDRHTVIGDPQRLRYLITTSMSADRRAIPASEEPVKWRELSRGPHSIVWVNDQAQGDAWLIDEQEVTPLTPESWSPGRFTVRTSSTAGAVVAVPANAFSGWQVSVDDGEWREATEFDGYVAATTGSGEHTYRFVYKAPMLPLVLALGALPWSAIICLGLGVLIAAKRTPTVPPSRSPTGQRLL